MKSFTQLKNESNETGVQFILVELEMGLSFLEMADHSSRPERQIRLYGEAKKAHDTIMGFMPRFTFTSSQQSVIDAKLHHLRSRLELLGYLSRNP